MIRNIFIIILILFVAIKNIHNYPLVESNSDNKLDKDEKRYPNGTVVGKYSYTDHEGNPIQVKYYADDASYGVELKSIKVMSGTSDNPVMQSFKLPTADNFLQDSEAPMGVSSDFYKPTNNKFKTNDPFALLHKNSSKNKNPYNTNYKTSPDYEVYFQNELKTPKKCGTDKVRVYMEKEKRKIREASQRRRHGSC